MDTSPLWFAPLIDHASRGSKAARPGSLAGLHEARKQHVGQFFTSPELAALMWRMIAPMLGGNRGPLSVLDNSAGVGRMFWPAPVDRCRLYAIELDGDACEALTEAAANEGVDLEVLNAPMQDTDPGRADVALINPPFGLTLTGLALRPYAGITGWGADGPMTAAPSIPYAIAHALEAASLVLAIVPSTFEPMDWGHIAPFHAATVELPGGLFRAEGTDVRVKLIVFSYAAPAAPLALSVTDIEAETPELPAKWLSRGGSSREPRILGLDHETPTIKGAVTGALRVRIGHDGRKLKLGFDCAFARAVVLNAILRDRCAPDQEGHRRAAGVEHTGQGWFDLENWIVTERAPEMLRTLEEMIAELGFEPAVDLSLRRHIERRARRHEIEATPFRRWAKADLLGDLASQPVGVEIQAKARRAHLANPKAWGSPAIRPTDVLAVVPVQAGQGRAYEVRRAGALLRTCASEEIAKEYEVELAAGRGWAVVHEGRTSAFPELAAARRRRAEEAGAAPFLAGWAYQLQDLIELTVGNRGVCAWKMGLGKTRLALGLALTGGESNLIAAPAHLIEEIQEEIQKLGLPRDLWQVITSASDCENLRKINLVSYSRLRAPIATGAGRRTIARLLRRRIHTLVADEADMVRNRNTLQTQALWAISPKRRYGMTGTPASNYIRCALPLLVWAGGDGTAAQPYGDHQPYISDVNIRSMAHSRRGTDVFAERHVTLEWAVREFTEDLRDGAKREVPKLRNVEAFRKAIAPHILRRVHEEPEVAAHVRIPKPTRVHRAIDWDMPHLASYVETAEDFARWYRGVAASAGKEGHKVNLIALLARIGAVFSAANVPDRRTKGPGSDFKGTTSKDRAAIKLAKRFTAEGRKSVIFASSPDTLKKLSRLLTAEGVESVTYDGTVPIARRSRDIKAWKNGGVPVMLASYGAAQLGLNWAMGSRVIAYNRDWSPRTEEQAFARVLRPQQQLDVEIHYLELKGSIDAYMRQLVEAKADAAGAGIDYEDQLLFDEEFVHLDTVIGRFCERLAEDLGLAGTQELKNRLAA